MGKIQSRSPDAMKIDDADGVVDFIHYDDTDKTFTHELLQDVEPILGQVSGLRENTPGSEWRHAGRFPVVLVNAWLNQRGLKMTDFKGEVLKEFVNDANHSAFRIWQGRV